MGGAADDWRELLSPDFVRAHLATWTGILQADAYGGYGELYRDDREPGPALEAGCCAHARRKFFKLADVEKAARKKSRGERTGQIYPITLEAVQRLDALFDVEREISGLSSEGRLAVRRERSAPLIEDLHSWLTRQLARLSRNHDLAKAINYILRRWPAFTRFLNDGRVCITNNAAERALRCVTLGRKSWLFCGSDRGGQRAAVMFSLIGSAKLNNVDPQAWPRPLLPASTISPCRCPFKCIAWARLPATAVLLVRFQARIGLAFQAA